MGWLADTTQSFVIPAKAGISQATGSHSPRSIIARPQEIPAFAGMTKIVGRTIGLLLAVLTFLSIPAAHATELTFAHLSDTHIDTKTITQTSRLVQHSQTFLKTAIKQIKDYNKAHIEHPVEFILITGDLVNRATDANYKALFTLLNTSQLPYVLTLGNHDPFYGAKGGKAKTLDAIHQNTDSTLWLAPLPKDHGYRSWVPIPGLRFVLLDGTVDTKSTAMGFFEAKQLDWLEAQLNDAKAKKESVVIALHYPPVEPFHSRSHQIHPPEAKRLNAILNTHTNVIGVLSGHYHTAKLQTRHGIVHVHSPSLMEYPNAFRIVTVDPQQGKMSLKWMPTTRTDLQALSKSKDRSPVLHLGKARDHGGTFQLRYKAPVQEAAISR